MKLSWEIQKWERWTLSIIAVIVALIAVIAMVAWREAHSDPRVTRYSLVLEGLAPGEKLTLAFLSDTHIDKNPLHSALDVRDLEKVVRLVNSLNVDAVILGGDYVSNDSSGRASVSLKESILPFSKFRAPLGVYAVVGNHDCWDQMDRNVFRSTFKEIGAAALINESVTVGEVTLIGIDDLWCGTPRIAAIDEAVNSSNGRPVILVSHNPDIFPQVSADVALTLAGHTHAGQIVPPIIGPIVSVSKFGHEYRYGLIGEGERRMIVTGGLGGLPFRLNTQPEIVVIDLISR